MEERIKEYLPRMERIWKGEKMNKLFVDSENGIVSIDGTELFCVTDVELSVKSGDFVTAKITFDCETISKLLIDGRLIWKSDIIPQVVKKDKKLSTRIKSILSILKGV